MKYRTAGLKECIRRQIVTRYLVATNLVCQLQWEEWIDQIVNVVYAGNTAPKSDQVDNGQIFIVQNIWWFYKM